MIRQIEGEAQSTVKFVNEHALTGLETLVIPYVLNGIFLVWKHMQTNFLNLHLMFHKASLYRHQPLDVNVLGHHHDEHD